MPISQRDFKGLPSSGIVPADRAPASQFGIGYVFSYTGSPDASNPNQGFTTRLVVHVENAAGDVKYIIRIENKWNLILFEIAPGLILFTWNWIPSAEKIEGFVLQPPTINVPPGWNPPQIATARAMTQLGNGASFGVEPAQGTGTSNGDVIVDSAFYSGIFTEPLDAGDRFVVRFHNASAGYVPSRASLQLATEVGVFAPHDLYDPKIGFLWHLYSQKQQLRCARTRQTATFKHELDDALVLADTANNARLLRHGATLYVASDVRGNIRIASSFDEGQTWQSGPIMLTNLNLLDAQISADGGTIFLYVKAAATEIDSSKTPDELFMQGDIGRVVLRRDAQNGWIVGEKGRIVPADISTAVPDKNLNLLMVGGELLVISEEGDTIRVYQSTDELATLKEIPVEVSA